ncbi:MAG: hypothetical protein Q9162_007611 [Coniocarpon cinnabarinum]
MNSQPMVNGHAERSTPAKQNRLSKACDGCSVRKVKCDEEGPPCRACRSLQIPCTFNRPSRRRGPPNRHAEAIKKQKLDLDASQPLVDGHLYSANTNGAGHSPTATSSLDSPATTFLPAQSKPASSLESIGPMDLLALFVDDFYTYIHPIFPFPHEPTFRTSLLQERRDIHDSRFLALAASMIGCLISTFPRRPLTRLKETNRKHLFRSSHDLVTRCRDIALEARGSNTFTRTDLSIDDAATSFFLGQIATNTFTVSSGELFFNECFNILRALGFQRLHDESGGLSATVPADLASFGQAPSTPQHLNLIERETSNRIYWSLFCLVRSAFTSGYGAGVADVPINPDTPLRRHPPLPLEVDDDRIFPDHVEPQPHSVPTPISGLNHTCRVHLQYEAIRAFKMAWLVDEVYDMSRQNEIYCRCMANAQSMHDDNLPLVFRITSSPQTSGGAFDHHGILSPAVGSAPHFPSPLSASHPAPDRRGIGIEIQKVNLHTTFLTTRTFYLEKYWSSNGHRAEVIGVTPFQAQEARLRTGRELLELITRTRVEFMEPSAFIFCMQVRQVTSVLHYSSRNSASPADNNGIKVEDDALSEGRETAQRYVSEFLKMLVTLQKGGRSVSRSQSEHGSANGVIDEEEELRIWAAKDGGVDANCV